MRALALIALGWLAACVTPTQRREEVLVREARTFADDLRWARYEQMTAVMPAAERAPFMGRVELVNERLVLADHEVLSINFAPTSDAAVVSTKIEWYYKDDPTVRTSTLEQRWEHQHGTWRMVQQRRVRGERFPLVTETTPAKVENAPSPAR